MKKRIMETAIFLALCGNAYAETGIPPEVPTMVEFSNKEINRIVCSGPISDLIFSKEKGLTGHFTGNNAYIKFSIEEVNGKRSYAGEPSELYVVCDGATYSLVANPSDRDAATVRLAPPKSDGVNKNISLFKNMPIEKQALKLIKEGYVGTYPSSYKVTENKPTGISLCPFLEVVPKESVDVDGVGLRLRIFQITLLNEEQVVDEKIFLSGRISDSILAVAVEDHKLKSGDKTRLFVVEKKEKDGPSAMDKTIKTTWSGGGE
jgi:conjugal transfer pilus assembly protein TraK